MLDQSTNIFVFCVLGPLFLFGVSCKEEDGIQQLKDALLLTATKMIDEKNRDCPIIWMVFYHLLQRAYLYKELEP